MRMEINFCFYQLSSNLNLSLKNTLGKFCLNKQQRVLNIAVLPKGKKATNLQIKGAELAKDPSCSCPVYSRYVYSCTTKCFIL